MMISPQFPFLVRCIFALVMVFAAGVAQAQRFSVSGPATLTETDADTRSMAFTIRGDRAGVIAGGSVIGWKIVHSNGTDAVAGADFTTVNGRVASFVFAINGAGSHSRSFDLTVVGDDIVESSETYRVQIFRIGGGTGSIGGPHTFTLNDDDSYADTTFTLAGPATIVETDTTVADATASNYTITRSGAESFATATIGWIILNSHRTAIATENADFDVLTGMVTFTAGETMKTFNIVIIGDDDSEGDELLALRLVDTNNLGFDLGSDLPVTIIDDDAPTFILSAPNRPAVEGSAPMFSVTYVSDDDGDSLATATTMQLSVLNDVPPGHNFTVSGEERAYSEDWVGGNTDVAGPRSGGTVIASVEFTLPQGLADNAVTRIPLPVVRNDRFAENREHYRVRIDDAPIGAILTPTSVAHTIAASDRITLSVVRPGRRIVITEGGIGDRLRVNFPGLPGDDPWDRPPGISTITIGYTVDDGTAMGSDIAWADVLANGYAEVNFAGSDDSTPALHRVYDAITITGVSAFNLNTTVASHPPFAVTVRDDDPQSWVVLAVDHGGLPSSDVQEDAPAHTTPLTAGNADDSYFRILVWSGRALEPTVRARTVLTYCIYGTARGGLSTDAARDFTWPDGYDPDADVSSMNSNCTAGSGTLTFAAGAGSQYRVPLELNDDFLNEGDETILIDTVMAVSDEGYTNVVEHEFYTGDDSYATRTILDNDDIDVSIAATSRDVDPDTAGIQVGEGSNAVFTVTLSHASASPVTVPYTIGGDVVTSDYTTPSNPLTLAAGATTGDITIFLVDDDDTEMEDLTVTLAADGYTAAGTIMRSSTVTEQIATVQVVTRIPIAVGFENTTYQAGEDAGQLEVCAVAEQSQPLTRSFSLAVSTRAGSAGDADYTAITNRSIGPFDTNNRRHCFNAGITSDTVAENSENFFLDLAAAPGDALERVNIIPSEATVTIEDDDPIVIGWTPESVGVATQEIEGAASVVTLTAVISMPGTSATIERSDFHLGFTTVAGTAGSSDYTPVSNQRIGPFGDAIRSRDIPITILSDTMVENTETFTVILAFLPGEPVPQNTTINPSTATVSIAAQMLQSVTVGFEETTYREREDVGQFEVCVVITMPRQSQPLNRMFSLSVSNRPGSAGNADYTVITNQIAGPFGNLRRRECFSVEVTNDTVPENSENFFLDLAPAPGEDLERVTITPSQATVTVIDNDRIVIGWAPESVGVATQEIEGAASVVTLTAVISMPSTSTRIDRSDFHLALTTDAGTAGSSDYTGLSGHRIGPFGDTVRRRDIPITILGDNTFEGMETFTARLHFIGGQPVPPLVLIDPANSVITISDRGFLLRVRLFLEGAVIP